MLGAALAAIDAGAEVLVFSRDSDGDEERSRRIADALEKLATLTELEATEVVGGAAEPCLEGWILVLARVDPQAERLSKPRVLQLAKAQGLDTEQAMVEAIRPEALKRIPPDSPSLRPWLDRARAVFAPPQ